MVESSTKHDVFLSYDWRDHRPVEEVARALRERGLTVFLDRWYLASGLPWPLVLEEAIHACRAVAVFLGPHGMGHWQQREKGLALERQALDPNFPLIPVLLPGADPALGLLSLNTWVDLRTGLGDPLAMEVLTAAVRGNAPGPDARDRITSTLAGVCPYRGLHPFREEDAPFFFGREAFVTRMLEATQRHSLVALVGASGSGKSSVVRAGLVPSLRSGAGGRVWDVVTLVPGERPLHALAAALVPLLEPEMSEVNRLAEVGQLADYMSEGRVSLRDVLVQVMSKQPGTDRMLLVVDQLEELFTLGTDEQVMRIFLDELLDATADGPLSVVFTLRGDFFGRALGYRPLADRLQDAVVNLGPMTQEELSRAVEAPAQKVGLTFEPGLVVRILNAVEQEPGNLPLLEFLLTDLWEERHGGQLTHEAYQAMEGVQGAMARRAEELFETMAPSDQEEVRRVFTQLVLPGEEDALVTRRRATFNEVGEAAWPMLQQLADARLLVTGRDEAGGEETVEVAHEALISNWGRLRGWLDEDREFLLWRHRLRMALAQWERGGHDKGSLLRGASLTGAERWLSQRPEDLNPSEQHYMREGLAQRGRERRLRWVGVAAAVAVLAVVALVLVIQRNIAVASQAEAEFQRQAVLAREVATQAQIVDNPVLQVLLGIESLRRFSTLEGVSPLEGDRALREGLALLARPVATMAHDAEVIDVAFSPDGKWLATASWDNTARVWQAATGKEVARMTHQDVLSRTGWGLAFSSDGRWLITAGQDSTARVWEAATGQEVTRMTHVSFNVRASISPDGRWVASGDDRELRVWEANTGRIVARQTVPGGVGRAAFGPDSTWLVTAGGEGLVQMWELPAGPVRVLGTHQENIPGLAISHDGRWIATGSFDDTAKVWDVATGEEVARLDHGDNVFRVAFSPDGKWLATAGFDMTARVWEIPNGHEVARMEHGGIVRAVAFSPDGRWLATAGDEKFARIWEAVTGREVARMTHEAFVKHVAFSPDGRWLATASEDGTARVWEVSAGRPAVRTLPDDPEELISAACSRIERNFTEAEWQQYFSDEPYRPTCPNLPGSGQP